MQGTLIELVLIAILITIAGRTLDHLAPQGGSIISGGLFWLCALFVIAIDGVYGPFLFR